MKDTHEGLKGFFKIELTDKEGKIIDSFEEKNLIVDTARANLAKLVGGLTSSSSINKFKIGTRGWVGDVTTPKTIVNGLNKDVTELFSESEGKYFYEIRFAGTSATDGQRNVTWETDVQSDTNNVSTVNVVINERRITYTIVMPMSIGNNNIENGADYTEAGFYCNDVLFNIKTFPIKFKDDSTQLTINWVLEF